MLVYGTNSQTGRLVLGYYLFRPDDIGLYMPSVLRRWKFPAFRTVSFRAHADWSIRCVLLPPDGILLFVF
jgi:hypothetical protein